MTEHAPDKFCKIKKTWENSSLFTVSNESDPVSQINKPLNDSKIEILEHVIIKEKTVKKKYNKFHADHIQVRTRKHSDGKQYLSYYCKICDREFKTKQQRYYHQYCDNAQDKPFKCSFPNCEKSFSSDSLKRDHATSHSTTNLFNCKHCQKTFKRRSSLRKHEYLHTENFKYSCECGKRFIDKVKYEIHFNMHKKLLPFTCKVCKKAFAAKSYLKKHEILHTDETKFQCEKCSMKFKWLTSFQLHKTSSNCSDNKEYFNCLTCSKTFFTKRALERHNKIHSNKRYKCSICESVQSNRKDNLMRHLRHIHPEIQGDEISKHILTVADEEEIQEDSKVCDEELPEEEPVIEEVILEIPQIPVINNRVNVICSVGRPTKLLIPEKNSEPEVPCVEIPDLPPPCPPPLPIPSTSSSSLSSLAPMNDDVIIIDPPQMTEKSLPPKKKKTSRPKYDPIKHYRKMLLLQNDDETHEEDELIEDHDHENPIAKNTLMHWRKRTSQKFSEHPT